MRIPCRAFVVVVFYMTGEDRRWQKVSNEVKSRRIRLT
jgi:hypothetical protein